MKILFVSPTWTEDFGSFTRIAKRRNSQPPLGILYLASAARKRGHTCEIVDSDVEDLNIDRLINKIMNSDYDVIGITATSPIFHKAVALAKGLKENNFKKPIIIGGEHINIFKKEAVTDDFDFAFYGESDNNFCDFLDVYALKGNYDNIPGLIYRKDGKLIQNTKTPLIASLDELEFPAMDLLNHEKYVMTFAKHKTRKYLPIMATRGCPFKCVFCSEPITNPNVRFRSPKNIVDEIEKWSKELQITHFFFMDSNLTLKKDQVVGICEEIKKRNLKITFEGWTRANLVDKDILTLLKDAGLIRISYGIESGDPEILKIIKKEVSHADILNAFKISDDLGLEVLCSVMLGLPGETRESVNRTIDFVSNIPQMLFTNFSIANPYPGTEFYDWAKAGKHGIKLLISDNSQYKRYDSSPISVNDLTQDDLVRLQKIGILKMHLRPKRILAAIKVVGFTNAVLLGLSLISNVIKNSICSIFGK
jgi:radical SAM superfamily enzyme YgiQ (UPF0313 family)